MEKGQPERTAPRFAAEGTLLGSDGQELKKGCWESCVYLGSDGFVYHLTSRRQRGRIVVTVAAKRSIGEYLRWVDGLFVPGDLPAPSNAVHYRAARFLREIM